jgi:hypothetical protein
MMLDKESIEKEKSREKTKVLKKLKRDIKLGLYDRN